MEDAMKPFYTGWSSGDALAGQDNTRYTQYGNTALSNTGTQNHQMLQHINSLQKMFMTGIGPDGKPLSDSDARRIHDFVTANQQQFTQGVYTPMPFTPKADEMPYGDAAPVAPVMPSAVVSGIPALRAEPKIPLDYPTFEQTKIPVNDLNVPQQAAPVEKPSAPRIEDGRYNKQVRKPKAKIKPKPAPNFMTNQGIQPLGKWNGGF